MTVQTLSYRVGDDFWQKYDVGCGSEVEASSTGLPVCCRISVCQLSL